LIYCFSTCFSSSRKTRRNVSSNGSRSFVRYEGAKVQAKILTGFAQEVKDSGYFKELVVEQTKCEVTYSIDDYLKLLSTLRKLEPQAKELLFAGLREKLEKIGDSVQLSFLSAVHVARKGS
jgi:hypothetical protein